MAHGKNSPALSTDQVHTLVEVLVAIRLYLIAAEPARRALMGSELIEELLCDIEMLNHLTDLLEAMIPSPAIDLIPAGSPGFPARKEAQHENVFAPVCGAGWIH